MARRRRRKTSCFDPRPREGATDHEGAGHDGKRCFDPRPREGATLSEAVSDARALVSIHAPVKGRQAAFADALEELLFRSTPP